MRIAVTAICLQNDHPEEIGYYMNEIFSRLVEQHPEHTFIFLFNGLYDNKIIYGPNVIPLIVKPIARKGLALKYWYDVKAPLALRRHKPDLWIQPGSTASLATAIPQLLVVPDLGFLHKPKPMRLPDRWFYARYMQAFLARAKTIITLSKSVKDQIGKHYTAINENKIHVVPAAAGVIFQQLSWQDKESVKAGFADNREYFLFIADTYSRRNMMNLLKAFSLFKKWQHSNMKLLITGRTMLEDADLVEKLSSYKYREDIILAGQQPEDRLAKITAAAYALVYTPIFGGSATPVIEAMQSFVPPIAADLPVLREAAGEAAVYADPSDPDAIAQQMIKLYRDETLRNNLIKRGEQQAATYDWNLAAARFWQEIQAVLPLAD